MMSTAIRYIFFILALSSVICAEVQPETGTPAADDDAKAKTIYTDSVHPHVAIATTKVVAVGTVAVKSGMAFAPTVIEILKVGPNRAFDVISQHLQGPRAMVQAKVDSFLAAQSMEIAGHLMRFPRGWLDIGLAALQGFVALFICFKVARFLWTRFVWRVMLKGVVWKFGFKFVCYKLIIGVTALFLWIAYKLMRLTCKVVFSVLRFCFELILCGAIGAGIVFGIEKSPLALHDRRMNVGLAAAIGLFCCMLFRLISCCRRRKALKVKDTSVKKGVQAPAKGAPAVKPSVTEKSNGTPVKDTAKAAKQAKRK